MQGRVIVCAKAYNQAMTTQQPQPAAQLVKVLRTLRDTILDGRVFQLAAGVAYFGTLAFFPLIAAVVAIAGLMLDQAQVQSGVAGMAGYLPEDIASLISSQLQHAASNRHSNGVIAAVALAFSIYGVSGATDGLIKATNVMYGTKNKRSFFRQITTSIGLTTGLIAAMTLILPLLFVGSALLARLGMPGGLLPIIAALRWILLLAVAMIGLGVFYYYAPTGKQRWRWISVGSVVATLLWLLVTAVFFIYLQYFASFTTSYSLFAGIIALMIWLNLSTVAVLLGAAVNRDIADSQTK